MENNSFYVYNDNDILNNYHSNIQLQLSQIQNMYVLLADVTSKIRKDNENLTQQVNKYKQIIDKLLAYNSKPWYKKFRKFKL